MSCCGLTIEIDKLTIRCEGRLIFMVSGIVVTILKSRYLFFNLILLEFETLASAMPQYLSGENDLVVTLSNQELTSLSRCLFHLYFL